MNLIELLFIIVCIWILYIGISFAWQDIRDAEKELEEVKKQKLYYLYNFDTNEGLQFVKYEGFIDYLNNHNFSFTVYEDKNQWLKMIKEGEDEG